MITIRFAWLVAIGFLQRDVDGARILAFFCQAARSHHMVFQPVIKELAARGHQVDYYTHTLIPDPPATLNQILLGDSEAAMKKIEEEEGPITVLPLLQAALLMRRFKFSSMPKCSEYPPFKELIASNLTYDMVIGEIFFMQEDYAVLLHKFKGLGVAVSSVPDSSWLNEMSGLPDNPAYMVHFLTGYSDHLSFFERVWNTVTALLVKAIDYYYILGPYQAEADKTRYEGWESRPSILDLSRDLALILTNSHHSLTYPYPKAPHVKQILGTNVIENPEPLPKDLQEYMDSAEHGVVYFSMGSILSKNQLVRIGAYDAFVNVFKKLKQKVIWKFTTYTKEEIPDFPNIKMAKWLPQQSILAHNKTVLFVTHGGLGGQTEAISQGVPMVGMPLFGDQFKNVKFMTTAGFGVALDAMAVTEEAVSSAVNEVLNNPKYKTEALRRSALFKDRPMKPTQEAVYWIEYVLRHGKVLQPASVQIPIHQLYLLDVLGVLVVTLIVAALIISKLISLLVSAVKRTILKIRKEPKKATKSKKER